MVLSYSRLMYLEFTVLQTMEHFLSAHENAFRVFQGVLKTLMVDTLKSAVLHRPLAEVPVFVEATGRPPLGYFVLRGCSKIRINLPDYVAH
jgi:hypothetical protein